jgi:hypothetical protein
VKARFRWLPVAGSALIVLIVVALSLRVSITPVTLASLPAPVHVASHALPDLNVEMGEPLFAGSRSNAPIGAAADAPPPVPPPTLTGVVIGGNRAVALVKGADGKTVTLHVGENVDGWTLRAIAPRKMSVERDGERQDVELLFAKPQPQPVSNAPSGPTPPRTG